MLTRHLGEYFLATVVFEHGYANDDAALVRACCLCVKELYLDGGRITDRGLERLKATPALKILTLSQTKVTDAGLENLQGIESLQYLYLKRSDISAAGVQEFRRAAPNCQVVVENERAK